MTSAANQAMQTLTQQYYNAITSQLNLSPDQFQLAQGNVALGTLSAALWSAMDAVPSVSVAQNWTPGNFNSFSSNYGSVLARISSSSTQAFQTAMGDYYSEWKTYLTTNPPSDYTKIPAAFKNWSMVNMDPGQAQKCYTLYNQAFIDPIGQAQEMWSAAGNAPGVKAYSTSIEIADGQIEMAPSGSVSLNSNTQSYDVSHTWAQGSPSGLFDFFIGGGSASYDDVTTTLSSAGIEMTISFTHVATLPVSPLESGTETAGPVSYPAWYVPAALQAAYNNNDFNIWNSGSPGWDSFFGDGGSLLNATRALIVVDGIKVTLTSIAAISTSEQQQFTTSFEAGFFPFFGVSGSGGWSNSQTFDDQGRLVVTSNCPTGNPQILGVLVSPIANALAAPAVAAARRAKRAVREPGRAMVLKQVAVNDSVQAAKVDESRAVITTAWTGAALSGLRHLDVAPQIETLISNSINNWAERSASNWALNVPQNYVSSHPNYTATARVVAINGNNRTVNVTGFF